MLVGLILAGWTLRTGSIQDGIPLELHYRKETLLPDVMSMYQAMR